MKTSKSIREGHKLLRRARRNVAAAWREIQQMELILLRARTQKPLS